MNGERRRCRMKIKVVFKNIILMLIALVIALVIGDGGRCQAQQAQQPGAQSFPITYGSNGDGLPRRLKVRGTITQVDYAPPRCGELIFPATFEVRLDGGAHDYKRPFVYLVVPCLYQPEGAEQELRGKRVEVTALKQDSKRRPCFYDIKTNSINSGGLPFYCVQREELLNGLTASASTATGPIEFEGTLAEGSTYRAMVECDREQAWRTVQPLRIPFHHAARIEWLNRREFPELLRASGKDCRRRIVFNVVAQETIKVSGQYRWNTTYRCRILRVEG
jgi:hypothetical protein